MKIKKIIKILILIISILITSISTSCQAFSKDNGKFIKLKNVPLGQPVYYSPTEVFFPSALMPNGNVINKYQDVTGIVDVIDDKFINNASAKIYNINTKKTERLNVKMNFPRRRYVVTGLDDGRILIIGGIFNGNNCKKAEVYNKLTNKFEVIGETNFNHDVHYTSCIKLDDGRILILRESNMEIFNPKDNSFKIVGTNKQYTTSYYQHKYINDKCELKTNGDETYITEYKGNSKKTRLITNKKELNEYSDFIKKARQVNAKTIYTHNYYEQSEAIKLHDGRVYILGNKDYAGHLLAEIYDPKTNKSTPINIQGVQGLSPIALLGNSSILIAPNCIHNLQTNKIYKVSNFKSYRSPRSYKILSLSNGNVLVVGGYEFTGNYKIYLLPPELYISQENRYDSLGVRLSNANLVDMQNNTIFIQTYKGKSYIYKY